MMQTAGPIGRTFMQIRTSSPLQAVRARSSVHKKTKRCWRRPGGGRTPDRAPLNAYVGTVIARESRRTISEGNAVVLVPGRKRNAMYELRRRHAS